MTMCLCEFVWPRSWWMYPFTMLVMRCCLTWDPGCLLLTLLFILCACRSSPPACHLRMPPSSGGEGGHGGEGGGGTDDVITASATVVTQAAIPDTSKTTVIIGTNISPPRSVITIGVKDGDVALKSTRVTLFIPSFGTRPLIRVIVTTIQLGSGPATGAPCTSDACMPSILLRSWVAVAHSSITHHEVGGGRGGGRPQEESGVASHVKVDDAVVAVAVSVMKIITALMAMDGTSVPAEARHGFGAVGGPSNSRSAAITRTADAAATAAGPCAAFPEEDDARAKTERAPAITTQAGARNARHLFAHAVDALLEDNFNMIPQGASTRAAAGGSTPHPSDSSRWPDEF